jgi:hypothetical protein
MTTFTDTPTSTTTTTTSTICTATATQTPIIILMTVGTSLVQFKEFVATLPPNDTNLDLSSWQPNMAYIATLNPCQTDELTDNPIVETWMIDAPVSLLDSTEPGDPSRPTMGADLGMQKERRSSTRSFALKHQNHTLGTRDQGGMMKMQQQSPGHLQWQSSLSLLQGLPSGKYLNFRESIYNDPIPGTTPPPIIYVIDSGFILTHEAIRPVLMDAFDVDEAAAVRPGAGKVPENLQTGNHGTCMASLAAGRYSSMGKHSRLVTIHFSAQAPDDSPPDAGADPQVLTARRVAASLNLVFKHASQNKGIENAVLSMSFGELSQNFRISKLKFENSLIPALFVAVAGSSLYWQQDPDRPLRRLPAHNPFEVQFENLWKYGIATVSSAGNEALAGLNDRDQDRDLGTQLPRALGGTNSPHIVVGNAMYDGSRYETSQYLDAAGQGILTVYNVGTGVDCATPVYRDDTTTTTTTTTTTVTGPKKTELPKSDVRWGQLFPGTSQATAITAGLIAYWMSQPDLRAQFRSGGRRQVTTRIKSYLVNRATALKGNMNAGLLPNGQADTIPRAASGDYVACPDRSIPQQGPVPAQTFFIPNPGFNRAFATAPVTEGQEVVALPLPICYQL